MGGILTLIGIENRKIRGRVSTWVMILVMAVLIFALSGLLKFIDDNQEMLAAYSGQTVSAGADWETTLRTEIESSRQQLTQAESSGEAVSQSRIDALKMTIAKDTYTLEHHLDRDYFKSLWNRVVDLDVSSNPNVGGLVALFVIIALSALVAGEYTEGTMKLMIPRPFSRGEILSAKLLSSLIYAFVLFVEALVIGLLSLGLFFGFGGLGATSLFWTGDTVIEIPAFLNALMIYGLDFLQVFVYLSFALLLAVLSRSRALATGLSIFVLVVGASLFQLLALYTDWGRYIVFAVSNFSRFIIAGSPYGGMTLPLALLVSAGYVAVFLFFSYLTFKKRDI
ncbi:ABC transporter permease subunit [Oscillospiraceae bacterium WX1]